MYSTGFLPTVTEALQSDPHLSLDASLRLAERLMYLCSESPAALKRLIELKPITPKTELWYLELLEHALPKWPSDCAEGTFRDWLESRTTSKSILHLLEFRRMCVRKPRRELILSPSQQRAWEHLHRAADIYFSAAWHDYRVAPNFNVLLAAPSGTGKSFLLDTFAATRGLPILRLAYGQWLPSGTRKQPDTVTQLKDFVLKHPRCCVYLDEIDKGGTGEMVSEWGSGVVGDVYATLDRTLFDSHAGETEQSRQILSSRLKRSVFIVAAGTWQSVFRNAARTAGFGGAAVFDPASSIAAAHKIPEELLRRFGGRPLLLAPPSASDLRRICREDGLDVAARQVRLKLNYQAAAESGEAMRWIGDIRLQIEMRRHQKTRAGWKAPTPITYLEVTKKMELTHE